MSGHPDQRAWIILEPPDGSGTLAYDDGWITIRVKSEFVQSWEYYSAAQPAVAEMGRD